MIQSDTMKTSSTVPGQIVIKVFRTNRVLKLIRLSAPIEREDASVNNFECKSITLDGTQVHFNVNIDGGGGACYKFWGIYKTFLIAMHRK